MTDNDRFLNVDKDTLQQMLILIRDRFGVAMTANYFLEHRAGISGTNIAMTNLRDVLSHLASLLGGPECSMPLSLLDQKAQLVSAEEHFRRAVYEPYEHAASTGIMKLDAVIERYKSAVISRGVEFSKQRNYPSLDDINQRWNSIGELRTQARAAKSVNLWNAQWEESVKKLIRTNEAISNFIADLEKIVIIVEAEKSVDLGQESVSAGNEGSRIGRSGIFWTILTAVISSAFAAYVSWYLAKHP